MTKLIVTHLNPDFDATTSVWLIKKFVFGWHEAKLAFVPAGETLQSSLNEKTAQFKDIKEADVLHVDTGLGFLDHHQANSFTCAAKLTLEFVKKSYKKQGKKENAIGFEALERLVEIVNQIDHFQDFYWPDAKSDIYAIGLGVMIDGWKLIYQDDHEKIVELGSLALEGIFQHLKSKVAAEKEIKNGLIFDSIFGRCLGVKSRNDEILPTAQKNGFDLVIRKDPKNGHLRIKIKPEKRFFKRGKLEVSLTLEEVYNRLRKQDRRATWYLHPSKKMLLNGSSKNPKTIASVLSLEQVIEVIKSID